MISLLTPEFFDAAAFLASTGYEPVSGTSGYITNCPDDMLQSELDAMVIDQEPARIAALWDEANEIALQFDHNSRDKALSWKVDGSPQWRLDRIAAIDAWMDSIWQAYYTAKATPGATTIGFSDPLPYTFSDLTTE